MTTKRISRRRALGLIAAGVASAAVGTAGWVINGAAYDDRGRVALRGVTGLPLAQPAALTSRDGVLRCS